KGETYQGHQPSMACQVTIENKILPLILSPSPTPPLTKVSRNTTEAQSSIQKELDPE
ncbi:hypothetical protein STEG23_030306, partial [Scotinomys teguina]